MNNPLSPFVGRRVRIVRTLRSMGTERAYAYVGTVERAGVSETGFPWASLVNATSEWSGKSADGGFACDTIVSVETLTALQPTEN